MLDADAWLDSAIYEFWNSLGRGYRHIEDFFALFRVRGIQAAVRRTALGRRDLSRHRRWC